MKITHRRRLVVLFAIVAGAAFVFVLTRSRARVAPETSGLSPARSFTHGHGLAVDVADPKRLYIATHEGLFLLVGDRDLYRVGTRRDDYMGFSAHPTDASVFFTSGHPNSGGNLGFQRSDDGGVTWQRIASGVRGPVDFHAMAVSPVNPDLLYGWYAGALQRSTDGGRSWEVLTTSLPNVIRLTGDPERADVAYAATVDGLMVSTDRAATWASTGEALRGAAVTAVAVFPNRTQEILAFSERFGLAKSADGGATWRAIAERFGGETPLHIAISRQQPDPVYMLTEKNSLFRSTDGGEHWERVRIGE